MIRFIKELLAGNVVEGGAGGAYPGADGQPGKAYGPGAIAGRGGKGGRFGRGGDGGNATVIGKGRAVGGAGGDVVDPSDGRKLFFVKGNEDERRERMRRYIEEMMFTDRLAPNGDKMVVVHPGDGDDLVERLLDIADHEAAVVKGTLRFPQEPGVYTLTVNETDFYDIVLPAPKGRAEGGAQ